MERKRQNSEASESTAEAKTPTVPELFLERAALDQASPSEQARLEATVGDKLPDELARLRQSSAEILARYPVGPFAEQAQARAAAARTDEKRAARWRPMTALAGLSVAALALLFLLKSPLAPGPSPHPGVAGDPLVSDVDPDVRLKGLVPQLLVYRQEGPKTVQLKSGASGRPGDLLQLGYVAAGQRHGALLSIDGGGAVTLHFPTSADGPSALNLRGPTLLDRAFRLDAAPGFERFFLITSSDGQPLAVAPLLAAAQALAADPSRARSAALPLAKTLQQTSLLLTKE